MPRIRTGTKKREALSLRLSAECLEHLEKIVDYKGGTVTGTAQEILEATKTVVPENYHQAVAALQSQGKAEKKFPASA